MSTLEFIGCALLGAWVLCGLFVVAFAWVAGSVAHDDAAVERDARGK